ncbi:MAG TPA: STAS domain-containing protein [Acidimicrobiales bacterium]
MKDSLEPLALKVTVNGRLPAVARVSGELDLATGPVLTAALADVQDGDVVLDCSDLSFIDATGLRAFQIAQQACRARGAKLVLVDPSPALERLLKMVGLDTAFPVQQEEEAS